MGSYDILFFIFIIISFSEGFYVTTPAPAQLPTRDPNNDWDALIKKNLTTFLKLYSYEDKRYYINSDFKATYIEAALFCEEIQMQLLAIESNEENEILYKYIRDANRGDTFWTSGTTLLDGHHWIWMTHLQLTSYTHWKKGEPNNPNEHCLAVNHMKGSGLFWNDVDCNSKEHFICEKELTGNNYPRVNDGNYKRGVGRIFHDPYVSPSIALFHFESKSYFVGRYVKATYLEALRLCTMINMNLVSIGSEEENTKLHKYIRDTNAGDKFWSSGTKLMDGKTWIWLPNAQPIAYTNWGKSEPDNSNHLCVQLDNVRDDGLFWNDYDCSSKNYYICEKPRYESFTVPEAIATTPTDRYHKWNFRVDDLVTPF